MHRTASDAPAVFHITHHKAGSQWVKSMLQAAAPQRFVPAQRQVAHVVGQQLETGKVYPTVYLTRERFETLDLPAPHRRFIICRDLRDTLVSLYFGLKVHHHLFRDDQRQVRTLLNEHSVEDGLIFLIGERLKKSADIQRSWICHKRDGANLSFPMRSKNRRRDGVAGGWMGRQLPDESHELLMRYEDLLRDPYQSFTQIMTHCRLDIHPQRLRELTDARIFRTVAKRNPGEENVRSHQRKGIAGDWRTHFTERVTDAFKKRFGQLLIDTGYERDENW